jgi:tetratricopeptide (TPR) repeat protein
MSVPEDAANSGEGRARPARDGQPNDGLARPPRQRQIDFDLGFFGRILERSPDYLDVLRCQGELLTRDGRHPEALDVDRRLVALLPGDSIVRYNLACSLALLGDVAEALRTLRAALELGYDDLEHLEADPDLDVLRDEPVYAELLREFGALK